MLFRGYKASLFVTVIALFAPFGWVLFVVWRCFTNFLTAKPWLWLWSPLIVLAAIQVISNAWQTSLALVAQAVLALLAGVSLKADHRSIAIGLLLALIVFLGLGVLEPWWVAHRWQPSQELSTAQVSHNWLMRSVELSSLELPLQVERQWRLPEGTKNIEFAFEARYETDYPDFDWLRSHPGFRLELQHEDGQPFTRVVAPPGRYHHLVKLYFSDTPLAGRTFRFEIDLRAPEVIERRGCRGLQLEVDQYFTCTPVSVGQSWQRYRLQWTVPQASISNVLRLLLIDFDGLIFDIRNPRLYEDTGDGWHVLGPLQPAGVIVRGNGEASSIPPLLTLTPQPSWQMYRAQVTPAPSDGYITLYIYIPSQQSASLRRVTVKDQDTQVVLPVRTLRQRISLWFEHANLAGHSIAVITILFASSAHSLRFQLIGGSLGVATVLMTGSRAAILAGALGFFWALWITHPRYRSRFLIFTCLLLLATLWVAIIRPDVLGRINPLLLLSDDGVNPISRWDIWQVALQALLAYPLTGLGTQPFISFMAGLDFPRHLIATHAHNLWLQFGAAYGIPGLLAALCLTGGLLGFAWRWGRWRGLGLVVPVMIMQVFDYTLFYAGVLFPLILGLNALRDNADTPRTM